MKSDRFAGLIKLTQTKPLIAIVDDDESVCHAIKRLVRSLGMEAATFASGREFIDHIEAMPSQRFDCVILDVRMAGLDGPDYPLTHLFCSLWLYRYHALGCAPDFKQHVSMEKPGFRLPLTADNPAFTYWTKVQYTRLLGYIFPQASLLIGIKRGSPLTSFYG